MRMAFVIGKNMRKKKLYELKVGVVANKLHCYKKQAWIQDIRDSLVLSGTKKGQVDPRSAVNIPCGSSGPLHHLTYFTSTSKCQHTDAMYHCSITADMSKVIIT